MREIENNLNNVNFKGIPKTQVEETGKTDVAAQNAQEPREQINDLGKMPSASLGKSQVVPPSSVEGDIANFQENPNLVAVVDKAIDKYAKTHTPQETLDYMNQAYREFFTTTKE